jgi:hypothetical protein
MGQLLSSQVVLKGSRFAWLTVVCAGLLYGCGGGQDFGGFSRDIGGDIGNGYNTSLAARNSGNGQMMPGGMRGTYPHIETSFHLPGLKGDPFDYEEVNVQVTLRKPDGGTVDVPAFFDGDDTWRMRFTPNQPGQYAVITIKLNRQTAHEQNLEKKDWTVNGDPQPGFVRVDKGDHSRFVFDGGARYFPLGQDQAWHSDKLPEIPDLFAKMHAAGENWTRVWMNHWDGKNLDWPAAGKPAKLGDIDLKVAKKWDEIVDAAEKNDIYIQLTLQHHGQYSSQGGYPHSNNNNPNWESNPYNVKNGGFLQNPEDFFTNPQARALTKRKLYYILARWGYSPNIMAWELFNEVEGTDAGSGKLWDNIAMWHREMALFLRQFDGYRHLITTSAYPGIPLDSPVWQTVDYMQEHTYTSDLITALGVSSNTDTKKLDKPFFVGEFGPAAMKDSQGVYLHEGLWASLMSGRGGAAQYWDWDNVEQHDLYGQFKAATAFLAASGLANRGGLVPMLLPVETSERAALSFGPSGGWGKATQTEFVVGSSGPPAGMERFPEYLQGQNHHEMIPKPLTLQVSYPQPGTFTVTVEQVAKVGAHLKLSVDGQAVEQDYPSSDTDYAPKAGQETLKVDVPVGAHTIVLDNSGHDWVRIGRFTLTNYASALAAQARVGKDYAVAWVYHRGNVEAAAEEGLSTATGKLSLTGLQKGHYEATWWDTHSGKSLDTAELTVSDDKQAATLVTPPIMRDVALYVAKPGTNPAANADNGKKSRRNTEKANSAALSPGASAPPPSGSLH